MSVTITVRESVREEECETNKIKTDSGKVALVSLSFGLPVGIGLVPVGGATSWIRFT